MDWLGFDVLHSEVLLKLAIAGLLSLIIGVEREMKKKPIGLKTSAVIATFSCLLTVVSIESAYSVPARDDINVTMDPLRLAAQIVSGIGFLGAGAILRRDNDNITGLTTAAMIWGAAGIGIAVGAGFYIEATAAVISVMIVIEIVAPLLTKVGPKRLRSREAAFVVILPKKENIDDLLAFLESENLYPEHLRIREILEEDKPNKHELDFRLSTLPKKPTSQLYKEITSLGYVEAVEIEIFH